MLELAEFDSTSARRVTPTSSGVGTETIIGPLPKLFNQGPVHSMPLVKMLPFTITRTWYSYCTRKLGSPVKIFQRRGLSWSFMLKEKRTIGLSVPSSV